MNILSIAQQVAEEFGIPVASALQYIGQQVPRQAGLTARALASGTAGMGSVFANPLAYTANKALEATGSDYRFPDQYEAVQDLLSGIGLPEPEGALEKVVNFAAEIGVPDPTDSARFLSGVQHMIDPDMVNGAIFAGLRSLDNIGDGVVMTSHGAKTGKRLASDHKKAVKLAEEGVDPWVETGWFKGADGNWRYEIDDSSFKYDPEGSGLGYQQINNLGDKMVVRNNQGQLFDKPTTVADHYGYGQAQGLVKLGSYPDVDAPITVSSQHGAAFPDLVTAYPQTADYRASVSVIDNMPGGGYIEGSFTPSSGFIDMKAPNAEKARSGISHELTHGVQDLEGFSPGANPRSFTQQKEAQLARDALSWRREMQKIRDESGVMNFSDLDRMASERYQEMGLGEYMPNREARELAKDFVLNPSDELERIVSLYMLDKQATVPTPSQMYRATAGEVEARNVQNRLNLTPDQRVMMHPMMTQDTPIDQQVFVDRYLGGDTRGVQNITPLKRNGEDIAPSDMLGGDDRAARIAALRAEGNAARFNEPDMSYRGNHQAPQSDYGAPGHDLTTMYPDDVYGPNGIQYYGTRDPMDAKSFKVVRQMRGNPDAEVTVYRAVPKGVKDINPGDWVTINKDYANFHGDSWVDDGSYEVISKKVKAKDIFTEGNSIHEWGYDPQ